MVKLMGGIKDQNISPPGLGAAALNVAIPMDLGLVIASASNAVLTFGSAILSATSVGSTTVAPGTNVDVPRNLIYEINISGDATGMVSAGTISVAGSDARGSAITESVALTEIAAAGSTGSVRGTACFGTLAASAFTVNGYLLATASSTRSRSISVICGHGNIIGLPNEVQSTNAIPYAWIGTAPQPGSYTVQTGPVPTAGVSMSNALGSGSTLRVVQFLNR